jgi:hypothetical protein
MSSNRTKRSGPRSALAHVEKTRRPETFPSRSPYEPPGVEPIATKNGVPVYDAAQLEQRFRWNMGERR